MSPEADPSARTRLVFVLHFHQPYGNLDEVFAEAMDRCYVPTLQLLGDHGHVHCGAHVSGPLLDWAEKHRPDFVDALKKLTARNQVEVLGGGYQEPMLAILPDRDAVGQLVRMTERCEELLGARPRGMWLTERVWEPDLPRVIAAGGYRYTLLDDTHLLAAGARRPLGAWYVSDKSGADVAIFPIDRGLRTRIPFADLDDLLKYLSEQRGRTPTYGDDAEKFGLWPTTERRVWKEKWLERFCDALRVERGWLESTTPLRVLDDTPSSGPIYMPTISYHEMGAWALPPDASLRYQGLGKRLRLAGFADEAETFVRGGIWQAFLAKYPESRLMYRKMLRVSETVRRAVDRADPRAPSARDALYRGQCNCPYWHGLFGGLYLQHLRSANMSALIEAEELAGARERVEVTLADHDGDMADEVLFEAPALNLYVSPARGGSGLEIDLRRARFHLTGVLGRRPEAYHEDVPRAQVLSDEELGNVSAHDLVRAVEPGLADKLRYDAFPRGAFVDHLLPRDADMGVLDAYAPLADFANAVYKVESVEQDDTEARAVLACARDGFRLTKSFAVRAAEIRVRWRLEASGAPRRVRFGSQLDFTLLTPATDGGRRLEIEGQGDVDPMPGARGVVRGVGSVRIVGESMNVDVTLRATPPAELWRAPIETVSQSERGFERAYQGTALVFVWDGEVGDDRVLEHEMVLVVA
jgi:4-alpha-glucanotransferase